MFDTNSNLSLFNFQGHSIRIVVCNGEPWFVARDVCEALGIANSWDTVSRLSEHQKAPLGISEGVATLPANTTIISEAGLYKLAFRSNKEEAEVFTDMVASVVLPTIRKTGRYSLPQQVPPEQHLQSQQEAGLQTYLLALSKDELGGELHYLHTVLEAVEAVYNYKYPHLALSKEVLRCELYYLRALLTTVEAVYNYRHPQKEHGSQPTETIVIPPVDAKHDVQTILLDYLHKTGTPITVRQLQQSGPRLLRNLPADHLRAILQAMVTSGVLTVDQVGKSEHYRLL